MDLTNEDIGKNVEISYKESALHKKEEQLANARYFVDAFRNYKVQVNIFEKGTSNHVCLQLGGQYAYEVAETAIKQYEEVLKAIKKDINKLKKNAIDKRTDNQ